MHIAFLNPQGNFDRFDSYLTEHPDFGGQLVYVKELSMALASMGVQIDIVTRQVDDPDWSGFSKQIDCYTTHKELLRIVRVSCGGSKFLEKETLWPHLPEFVSNLQAFYGKNLPDYLTAHYADGGYCALLMQHATELGFTFTGHSLGAQKLDKLGMTPANMASLEQRFHFAQRIDAERLSMQRADTIITSTSQERFEQYGHALYQGAVETKDDNRFSVIPPGVNTKIFSDAPQEGDTETDSWLTGSCGDATMTYIVVSSRLDEKKNIAGVVEAYASSPEVQQRARLGLFVRGVEDPFTEIDKLPTSEQAVLRPILAHIDATEIKDKVDFFNITSQQQLAAAYRFFARRRSIFALTSFYEPFGLAPIEAAACGLVVVATRNGGPTEIFSDGSAVLVDPQNTSSIAHGLLDALQRGDELSERGKQRVLSKYTWDQTARAYLQVIERGVASQHASVAVPQLDASERISNYLHAVPGAN